MLELRPTHKSWLSSRKTGLCLYWTKLDQKLNLSQTTALLTLSVPVGLPSFIWNLSLRWSRRGGLFHFFVIRLLIVIFHGMKWRSGKDLFFWSVDEAQSTSRTMFICISYPAPIGSIVCDPPSIIQPATFQLRGSILVYLVLSAHALSWPVCGDLAELSTPQIKSLGYW